MKVRTVIETKGGITTVCFPTDEEADFTVRREGSLVAVEVRVFDVVIRFRVFPADAKRLAELFAASAAEDGTHGCDTCEKADGLGGCDTCTPETDGAR